MTRAPSPRRCGRLPGREGALLFIDQMEELCTVGDPREVAAVARALGHLAAERGGVKALGTVRGNLVTRLAELPGLGPELARSLYILRHLLAAGLREAIVGPARCCGAAPKSEELVQATLREGGGQPLRSFALSELWEARDRERRIIPRSALTAVGGVAGALRRHADGVIERLLPAGREVARRLLCRLVTPEGLRVRRSAAELPEAPGRAVVLEALVRGRLVVAGPGDSPEDGTCPTTPTSTAPTARNCAASAPTRWAATRRRGARWARTTWWATSWSGSTSR